ncbi:MAG: hypothetical protein ACFB2W_13565 [Leptolyngbyaceae cyanobacterium]
MPTKPQSITHTISKALKAGPQRQIEQLLDQHLFNNDIEHRKKIAVLSQDFRKEHYVCIKQFMPLLLQTGVRGEIAELLPRGSLVMSTTDVQGTETLKILKIFSRDIESKSTIIPALYYSQILRKFLSLIADSEVIPYSFRDQSISIVHTVKADYHEDWEQIETGYQLVWFIEVPRLKTGEALEFNKISSEQLEHSISNDSDVLSESYTQQQFYRLGDAFLLKHGNTLFRFPPLANGAERIVVTMNFSDGLKFKKN